MCNLTNLNSVRAISAHGNHHGLACLHVANGEGGLHVSRVASNRLNKQPPTAGSPSAWGLGDGLIFFVIKFKQYTENFRINKISA
jgi:hypothetical protein